MQCLVHGQTQLVRYAMLKTKPVQFVTEQRCNVVAASASVDELSRSVEDGLQSVHLLIRNSRKKRVLVVASREN